MRCGAFPVPSGPSSFGPRVRESRADLYGEVWLNALVALLQARGTAEAAEVREVAEARQAVALVTAHGKAIPPPNLRNA